MAYLLDTNCTWRRFVVTDPAHAKVKAKIDTLLLNGETLYITAQNMVEFQALATRPTSANGLGLSKEDANNEAKTIEALFPLLPENADIYTHWRTLMDSYDVKGRNVFDARLVAVMLTYGITHILTLNRADFQRFAGITIEEP
jgi:predicted nucleic acid-binding protein